MFLDEVHLRVKAGDGGRGKRDGAEAAVVVFEECGRFDVLQDVLEGGVRMVIARVVTCGGALLGCCAML